MSSCVVARGTNKSKEAVLLGRGAIQLNISMAKCSTPPTATPQSVGRLPEVKLSFIVNFTILLST